MARSRKKFEEARRAESIAYDKYLAGVDKREIDLTWSNKYDNLDRKFKDMSDEKQCLSNKVKILEQQVKTLEERIAHGEPVTQDIFMKKIEEMYSKFSDYARVRRTALTVWESFK